MKLFATATLALVAFQAYVLAHPAVADCQNGLAKRDDIQRCFPQTNVPASSTDISTTSTASVETEIFTSVTPTESSEVPSTTDSATTSTPPSDSSSEPSLDSSSEPELVQSTSSATIETVTSESPSPSPVDPCAAQTANFQAYIFTISCAHDRTIDTMVVSQIRGAADGKGICYNANFGVFNYPTCELHLAIDPAKLADFMTIRYVWRSTIDESGTSTL